MAEYIEREALLQDIEDSVRFTAKTGTISPEMRGTNKIIDRIKCAPAADVVPIRHGHWLTWEEQFPGSTPKKKNNLGVFCDKCHNHADNQTDYCPNCGAKMVERKGK